MEHTQRQKEKIEMLRKKKAFLKEKASKYKLIAQRCRKEEERKRKERERTNIMAYFGRGRVQTSSSKGSNLPWGARHFATPGSSLGTAIEVLSLDSREKSSSGSSVGDSVPELLLVTEDDLLAAEIPGDELQLLSNFDEQFDNEEDGAICSTSPTGKRCRNYNRTMKFQLEWQAKLPWAEGVLTEDGHMRPSHGKVQTMHYYGGDAQTSGPQI